MLATMEEKRGHERWMIEVMPVEVMGQVSEEEKIARLEKADEFSYGISK